MERGANYNPLDTTTLELWITELEERVTALEEKLSGVVLWKRKAQEDMDHTRTEPDAIQGTRTVRRHRPGIITGEGLPLIHCYEHSTEEQESLCDLSGSEQGTPDDSKGSG
ncbi:hypothetical protein MTO96_032162 [Rhipicephalus appendiculatus]